MKTRFGALFLTLSTAIILLAGGLFFIRTVLAAESSTPNLEIKVVVDQDGTEPFDGTDPLVDGSGAHTPGLDGSNGAIEAAHNGVVRTKDRVRYRIYWNVNDVDSAALSGAIVHNVVVRMDTGREDVRWYQLPKICLKNNVTPVSEIGDNGNGAGTYLVCNLGDRKEGEGGSFYVHADVYLKADLSASNGDVISVAATVDSDETSPVTSGAEPVTISARSSANWVKGHVEVVHDVTYNGVVGEVFIYPIVYVPGPGGSGRGTEWLDDSLALQFYDHAWDLGPSAIFMPSSLESVVGRKACGGYDGAGQYPYGDDGQLPPGANDGIDNETAPFDVTCTDVTSSGGYPMVRVDVSNYSTRVLAEKTANGKRNTAAVSLQVAFWVSEADVLAKSPNSDPFWNTINRDDSLDTSGADPSEGLVPNTEPVQIGGRGGYLDENGIGDNSVADVVLLPTGGSNPGNPAKYRHYVRLLPGPYQEVFYINGAGAELAGFDARRVSNGGAGTSLRGDASSNFKGDGVVSRNDMITLIATAKARDDQPNLWDDPVHLCVAIDNSFVEVVDFPHSFIRKEVDALRDGTEIGVGVGTPSDGIAHVLMGTADKRMAHNWWYYDWVRKNPAHPDYVVEVAGGAVAPNVSEHGVTCNDEPGVTWVSTTDATGLQQFATGVDIDGNTIYGGITRVRVRMLEHASWYYEDEDDPAGLGMLVYTLNMQLRVKPNRTGNHSAPDGSEIYVHASRGRGDWTTSPALADCTNDDKFTVDNSVWCNMPYDTSREGHYDTSHRTNLDLQSIEYYDPWGRPLIGHTNKATVVTAVLGGRKTNLNPDELLINGDLVTFKIEAWITGSPTEQFARMNVSDDLSQNENFEFVSWTPPVDRNGNPVSGYVDCTEHYHNIPGRLVCSFSTADSSTWRSSPFYATWTVTARLVDAKANSAIPNQVSVQGYLVENGQPSEFRRFQPRAYAYTAPPYYELKLRKQIDPGVGPCREHPGVDALARNTLEAGDCTMFPLGGVYTTTLTYANHGNEDQHDVVLIDVLPYNGDASEPQTGFSGSPPPTGPVGDGRTPESDFVGTSQLQKVVAPSGATVECTTDAPNTVNRDPANNNSSWSSTCDGNATAVRISIPLLEVGDAGEVAIGLQSANNGLDDIYTNNFGGRSDEVALPLRSNDVSAMSLGYDWGDLPGSFDTERDDNIPGPSHVITDSLYLGSCVDGEYDGASAAHAGLDANTGDDGQGIVQAAAGSCDATGDDEDGVKLVSPLIAGSQSCVEVSLHNGLSQQVHLYGWIDFNGDGQFASSEALTGGVDGDRQFQNGLVTLPASADISAQRFCFKTPANATFEGGETHMRFRLTSESLNGSTLWAGPAKDGEVEDYWQPLVCVGNYLWWDVGNSDNQQDGNDAPMDDGVTVRLTWAGPDEDIHTQADNLTYETTTLNGLYNFCGLLPDGDGDNVADAYQVSVPTLPGPLVTPDATNRDDDDSDGDASGLGPVFQVPLPISRDDNAANDQDPHQYPDTQTDLTYDFGFRQVKVALGNRVWEDTDKNSRMDSGEPGINGVTVQLYRDRDGDGQCEPGGDDGTTPLTSTVTSGGGYYQFLKLEPSDPNQASSNYCVVVVKSSLPATYNYNSPGWTSSPDVSDEEVGQGDDGYPWGGYVVSRPIQIMVESQSDTSDDGDPPGYRDNSAYMTVDFGFYHDDQPTAVRLRRLQTANSLVASPRTLLLLLIPLVVAAVFFRRQRRDIRWRE